MHIVLQINWLPNYIVLDFSDMILDLILTAQGTTHFLLFFYISKYDTTMIDIENFFSVISLWMFCILKIKRELHILRAQ